MRVSVRLALATAVVAGIGCAGSGESRERAQATTQGEALYTRHCAACHGSRADGAGPVAVVLDPPPPDLTRIAERNGGSFPQAAVLRMIDGRDPVVAHGPREMPIWGERFAAGVPPSSTEAEAARRGTALVIVEYLRGLQR